MMGCPGADELLGGRVEADMQQDEVFEGGWTAVWRTTGEHAKYCTDSNRRKKGRHTPSVGPLTRRLRPLYDSNRFYLDMNETTISSRVDRPPETEKEVRMTFDEFRVKGERWCWIGWRHKWHSIEGVAKLWNCTECKTGMNWNSTADSAMARDTVTATTQLLLLFHIKLKYVLWAKSV